MPGDAPKGPFVVPTPRLRLAQHDRPKKTLLVKLNMGPQQRHAVPKIAVRITVTGLGGRYRADLEIGLLVRCDRRPFAVRAAVRIVCLRDPRPVAHYAPLDSQVRLGRLVLALPGEEERVLDR